MDVQGPGPSAPVNGGLPAALKTKKKQPVADPLFRKKPLVPKPPQPVVNGRPASSLSQNRSSPLAPVRRSLSPSKESPVPEERVSGFSDPRLQPGTYRDFKLVTSKRTLMAGMRFHLLQFPEDQPLDIRNEQMFTRPVRLHRRDLHGAPSNQAKEETEEYKDGLDKAEREELNARKEARQKERELNLAQIAPSVRPSKGIGGLKKKTAQVYRPEYNAEDRRRIQNNYEEKLPWHLEDFDNIHCLVGAQQIGASNSYVAFVFEPSAGSSAGKFRLFPVEKCYNFKPKPKPLKVMTIDEAEEAMKRRGTLPEWLIRQRETRLLEAQREIVAKQSRSLFSGAQKDTVAGRQGEEADFDYDEDFADDEEGDLFLEKDEDAKLAEKRIKEDQLQANFLDFKQEKDYDRAEEMERRMEEARRKRDRRMHRKLELREKNYNHGSDSENEYDSTDSEEERVRIEAEKKAIREKAEAAKSGISSGTNTPSGRRDKHGMESDRDGGMKKSGSVKPLKRPGSPNLSDASATDSSTRKKSKHRHLSSTQPTPQPSRPISPAPPSSSAPDQGKLVKKRKSMAPGSAGSDAEAAAYSDGAMSDGSKVAKRIKLNPPIASGSKSPPEGGSRAASPSRLAGPASTPTTPSASLAFPSAAEIAAAIPDEGVSTTKIMNMFKSRMQGRTQEFTNLVKEVGKLVPREGGVKVLVRKGIWADKVKAGSA